MYSASREPLRLMLTTTLQQSDLPRAHDDHWLPRTWFLPMWQGEDIPASHWQLGSVAKCKCGGMG